MIQRALSSLMIATLSCLLLTGESSAQEAPKAPPAKKASDVAAAPTAQAAPAAKAAAAKPAKPSVPPHKIILKDAKKIEGVINLYQKDQKLYAELSGADYKNEFIVLISIARGIGQRPLLGGMSWGFGDDWVWQFRKIGKRVHIIRKNVRFKANKGSPESSAVHNAYTDSVLFSLPVMTKGPRGGDLIDLSPVFMSDLPQISQVLAGFAFSPTKSTWATVKGFKDNVELEVAATYASAGRRDIEQVPDSRGVTLNVHYSISKLAQTGYTPRLADDRVGYFLTAVKDFSKKTEDDRFVRYTNRWNLQKADPKATLSPPKEPIVFWIEKTVPFKYRGVIREGILEWNKAFEKAGFVNAIEVRQQPDDATWDPEDINYNTFRWITASAGFAMGPSRVNPYTGQILDADIIFDADFLTFWNHEFDTFSPKNVAAMTGGDLDHSTLKAEQSRLNGLAADRRACALSRGMAHQFAIGSAALLARAGKETSPELKEKLIMQGLKEVTMHEVGHTLGLRHNFKASTWRTLKEINNPANADTVASVMDYNPTNIAGKKEKQGNFYPTTIGPYDLWAIEYGYKPLSGGTAGEVKELKKIASRSGEPALAFTTDEDTVGTDPDPYSNRFDLGKDAVAYAKKRAALVKELMPGLTERMTKDGDDYTQVRRAFNILLAHHGQGMYYASRIIGGLDTSRSHKGDKGGKPPITVIDVKKQREAMALLEEQVFGEKPFQFPPELYNHLGPTRWRHWGTRPTIRKDFPVHDFIAMWQNRILSQLLSSVTLERIHDTELKVPAKQDALTTAELIQRLTKTIFSEVDTTKGGKYTNRQPAISSLRRNLQRNYLRRLTLLALGNTKAPEDCQTVAFAELMSLEGRIKKLLKSKVKLDSYSHAHLQETGVRIQKVLDARLVLLSP